MTYQLRPQQLIDALNQKILVAVTLIIPAKNSSHTLESTVIQAHHYLTHRFPQSFEIIIVPNPSKNDLEDQSLFIAEQLAKKLPFVRSCLHTGPVGKGAAIRTGFLNSRGKWIFFTDADLPYDLSFFDEAAKLLESGFDLVNGNRRLPSSQFHVPVSLLPLAYGRHRLGLGFNQLVRWLFPITTTDTQAGIKALSRRLAIQSFSRQTCPGFLFDLELFLTAYGQGYSQIELPVTLYLNTEKSTVRILRECLLVANWLIRIAWKNKRNYYGHPMAHKKKIMARYQQASLGTRLFLFARWYLTPYSRMAAHLPVQGNVLDLGCGHGLFALAAGMRFPSRKILGIDHDPERIALGSHAIRDFPNIRLEAGSISQPPQSSTLYTGISMIDVMHYFEPEIQKKLLKQSFELLEKGGTLLVREVDPNGGMTSYWNRLYEKIATRIGFTRAEKKGLHFRSQQGWKNLLETIGFKVNSERCSSLLFADILYICERPHESHIQ